MRLLPPDWSEATEAARIAEEEPTLRGTHKFFTMEFEEYIAGACFDKESDAKVFTQSTDFGLLP